MRKIFVDSDVIISSLISQSGAAHHLLQQPELQLYLSNFSVDELKTVCNRLNIQSKLLDKTIDKYFQPTIIINSIEQIKKEYEIYTTDPNDCHIVAGAVEAKTDFLVTYNQKHFEIDRIKKDFNTITLTPGQILQYLRTQIS